MNGTDRQVDILTIGDLCVDLVLTGNVRPQFGQIEQLVGDCSLELGGSGAIFACQVAKLGLRSAIAGCVGSDLFGEFIVRELSNASVDIARVKSHPTLKTGVGVALSEENDRAILAFEGTINALRPEELDEDWLKDCRHFHQSAYYLLDALRPRWPSWFALCHSLGVTVSLDTNWDPANRWTGVEELLPYVDVFLPNEQEACAIARESDVEAAADRLAALGPTVVVKRGPAGALAVRGKERWRLSLQESERPATVVDTTGAGDNFDAGFLSGWIHGLDMDACMKLGHRCAVGSLVFAGGTRGQLREVLDLAGGADMAQGTVSGGVPAGAAREGH